MRQELCRDELQLGNAEICNQIYFCTVHNSHDDTLFSSMCLLTTEPHPHQQVVMQNVQLEHNSINCNTFCIHESCYAYQLLFCEDEFTSFPDHMLYLSLTV
jgi:hypothetical protein